MTSRGSGIALAIASALMAVAAVTAMALGLQNQPAVSSTAPPRASVPSASLAPTGTASPSSRPAVSGPGNGAPSPTAAGAPSSSAREATVVGDGPAGDAAIQKVLEASSPANLPAALEQQLASLGRSVWLAQVTGQGRGTWPAYFRGEDTRWIYTHVRIQASIARLTTDGRALVKLVWAGTDPTGQPHEAQPATITVQSSGGIWQPVR